MSIAHDFFSLETLFMRSAKYAFMRNLFGITGATKFFYKFIECITGTNPAFIRMYERISTLSSVLYACSRHLM